MKTKMTQEEFIKFTERMNKNITSLLKDNEEELIFYSQLVKSFNNICEKNNKLQEKNKQLQERIEYLERSNNRREDTIFEQSQKIIDLEDKLSKIETLIINHNYDTGDIYYKYNSKFLKSELKQRILDILNEVSE